MVLHFYFFLWCIFSRRMWWRRQTVSKDIQWKMAPPQPDPPCSVPSFGGTRYPSTPCGCFLGVIAAAVNGQHRCADRQGLGGSLQERGQGREKGLRVISPSLNMCSFIYQVYHLFRPDVTENRAIHTSPKRWYQQGFDRQGLNGDPGHCRCLPATHWLPPVSPTSTCSPQGGIKGEEDGPNVSRRETTSGVQLQALFVMRHRCTFSISTVSLRFKLGRRHQDVLLPSQIHTSKPTLKIFFP